MRNDDVRWRHAGVLVGAMMMLSACGHHALPGAGNGDDEGINAYPTNYRADVLGGMHAYLNNPTGIRDAAISDPMLKQVGDDARYVVCIQANAKLNGNTYAGVKEFAAVFLAGHLDHFDDKAQQICAGVSYTPFPQLEKLPP